MDEQIVWDPSRKITIMDKKTGCFLIHN